MARAWMEYSMSSGGGNETTVKLPIEFAETYAQMGIVPDRDDVATAALLEVQAAAMNTEPNELNRGEQ
jgi:hypothetical protein